MLITGEVCGMKKKILYVCIAVMVVIFNIIAWTSTSFSDWYIGNIFPIWLNTYGRFNSIFPFSVGEILIVCGIALVVAVLISTIIWLISEICKKGKGIRGYIKKFYEFFAWVILLVCVIMSLNCTMVYHGTGFGNKYLKNSVDSYSRDKLVMVRNYVVEKCNELSLKVNRDAYGNVIIDGDMNEIASASMKKLGEQYDNLSGYYPKAKPMMFSDLMCQQSMQGYYFPFSMEANYNNVMKIMKKPATICHELAHIKGYIYEDDANFIGFLACIQSGNLEFEYSGYLSILYYLDNDFYASVNRDIDKYMSEIMISPLVHEDNTFVSEEQWARINKKALLSTEAVEAASDAFTEGSLKLNGVSDGMISYTRVVKLLLSYYEGKLY